MADMNEVAQGTPTGLTRPRCAGRMRSYERNGITIDQCTECRGILLDRGELERLVGRLSRRALLRLSVLAGLVAD